MGAISTTNEVLATIAKVVDYFKTNVAAYTNDSSLTQMTKLTRAEPLTVISQDCANLEYLPNLLNNLTSIYSGYFLQAVSMLTTVNNVEVVRVLDALNPNRDSTGFLLQGRMANLSAQSLAEASFVTENYKHSLPTRRVFANEEAARQQDTVKMIYELEHLAVGKLLNVDIQVPSKEGDGRPYVVTIPVVVRLSPAVLNEESLIHLFTHRKEDTSLVERFHSWRAGRISLIRDMIFCQDLIDEYRRAAIKDKSGTLQEIVRRVNANRTFGLLSKNPSMAISSNLYVISSENARQIEAKTGHRFSDHRGRENLFKGTYAMVVAVVDPDLEIVDFYFNGISQSAKMNVRSIKSGGKNKGPDITDVMRTLLEGRAPSF